jgi:cellulose synthase operon protein YhjQ
LGLEAQDSDGICELSINSAPWSRKTFLSGFDVSCLPYGTGSEEDREVFEAILDQNPNWLRSQINRSGISKDAVVLLDTPPGASVYQKQVFACADLMLVIVLADAGSYATIPAMETCLAEMAEKYPNLKSAYVLNQIDRTNSLNRDVADLLQRYLSERIVPIGVHLDSAVGEALAFQQPVLVYDPHGQASHDLDRLATWVIEALNE